FTYLTSALTASVTSQFVDGKGIKVKIWPAQIMSTALIIREHAVNYSFLKATSGAQLLRMRFSKDNNGDRTQPISGWITLGPNGKPVLSAEVDLYMDGLELAQKGLQFNDPTHTLNSYPITMNL